MSAAKGPYRGPRVRGLPERMGRVYLSRGDEGQPALLQVGTGETPHLQLEAVQVLVTVLPAPGGVAVQVQGQPPPRGLVTEAVLGALEGASDLVEHVGYGQSVREHLSRTCPSQVPARAGSRPLRPRWVPALAVAAGLALLVWPGATVNVRVQDPPEHDYVWDVPATEATVHLTDIVYGSSTPEPWSVRRRVVIPEHPLPGQDTPPCRSPAKAIRGGCWLQLKQDAPCPANSAEHNGGCWVPIRGEERMPVGLGRERGR